MNMRFWWGGGGCCLNAVLSLLQRGVEWGPEGCAILLWKDNKPGSESYAGTSPPQ